MSKDLTLKINGQTYELTIGDRMGQVPETETLLETLRDRLGLTGTKLSCGEGACGCCAVLTSECEGKEIVTIEGLSDPVTGKLDPIQEAFLSHNAFQCGFCTPGIIIAVKSILDKNPHPTDEEIEEALSGNFCRCISHYQVIEAVQSIIKGGDQA